VPARAVLPEESPYRADFVLSPRLAFDGYALHLTYVAVDETSHVRVTFEGLDAFRCARGEYLEYEAEDDIAVVEPSDWLIERHAYEAKHYGSSYEWGRGADTMLTDTHHYLFSFHDEFVEVLARGLWFELSPEAWAPGAPLTPSHPAQPLGPETSVEAVEFEGVRYDVRANPRPVAELVADARLFSQPLFELRMDSLASPQQAVRLRATLDGGEVRAWLENSLGVESATFDHVPGLDEVMPLLRTWMSEVAERRRNMPRGIRPSR
jgi:hypothetical protein